MDSPSTNTTGTSQPVLAWTFLMKYFLAIIKNCTIYGITNRDLRSFPKTSFSKRLRRLVYQSSSLLYLRKFLRSGASNPEMLWCFCSTRARSSRRRAFSSQFPSQSSIGFIVFYDIIKNSFTSSLL